jgi:hypothetical protein
MRRPNNQFHRAIDPGSYHALSRHRQPAFEFAICDDSIPELWQYGNVLTESEHRSFYVYGHKHDLNWIINRERSHDCAA